MVEYKIITKNNVNYTKLRDCVINLYKNDTSHIADIEATMEHFKFIFGCEFNNAFLVLLLIDGNIVSMVNFFEYNNVEKNWCEFSLFVKSDKRGNNYSQLTFNRALEELNKYECFKLICGIESDNTASIYFHEKNGFKYSGLNWDELEKNFPGNHLGYVFDNIKDLKRNKI